MYFERSGSENGEVPLEAAEFEAPKSETKKAERAALLEELAAASPEFNELKNAATEQAAGLVEGTMSSAPELWQTFVDASITEITMTGAPEGVARELLAAAVREVGAKKESQYMKQLSESLKRIRPEKDPVINSDEFMPFKQELDHIQKLYKMLKTKPEERRKAA